MRTVKFEVPIDLAWDMYSKLDEKYHEKKEELEKMLESNKANPKYPAMTFLLEEEVAKLEVLYKAVKNELELFL